MPASASSTAIQWRSTPAASAPPEPPIDQHVKGFTALGAKVMVEGGFINASTETGRLKGANIYLDVVSVGATMNIMMAAVGSKPI